MSSLSKYELHTRILYGCIEQRGTGWGIDKDGNAWHRDADYILANGLEDNRYVGPVPFEDLERRLFSWQVQEGTMTSSYTVITEDGVEEVFITDTGRKVMMRPRGAFGEDDPGAILGAFKDGYQGHQYLEWLYKNVSTILDSGLIVFGAGVLADGAEAYVEVSVPDTTTTPEGVEFRPILLATTSFNGKLATTYKRSFNRSVCDNTRDMVLAGAGEVFRTKHTRNSASKLTEARDALNIVHTMSEEFAAEVKVLCETSVSEKQWSKFLDELAPTVDENGDAKAGRALTMVEKKRSELQTLWNTDARVSPWKGTAEGVLQAVNTWSHHIQSVKGSDRSGRNASMSATGKFADNDRDALTILGGVLTAA